MLLGDKFLKHPFKTILPSSASTLTSTQLKAEIALLSRENEHESDPVDTVAIKDFYDNHSTNS